MKKVERGMQALKYLMQCLEREEAIQYLMRRMRINGGRWKRNTILSK